jgi:hypothetical protein
MGFTDAAGHRFQVFITNQPDPDPAILEACHRRPHARVEDRIRGAKASGLRNLPFWGFAANDAWLSLVGIAQTLVCWAQALLLVGRLQARRAQDAAVPAVARRRPDRPPRPPRHRPYRPRLALGRRPRRGVHPAARPARPLLTIPTHPRLLAALPAGWPPACSPGRLCCGGHGQNAQLPGPITPTLADLSVPQSRPIIQAHPTHTSQPRLHNPTGLRVGSAGGASAVPA